MTDFQSHCTTKRMPQTIVRLESSRRHDSNAVCAARVTELCGGVLSSETYVPHFTAMRAAVYMYGVVTHMTNNVGPMFSSDLGVGVGGRALRHRRGSVIFSASGMSFSPW